MTEGQKTLQRSHQCCYAHRPTPVQWGSCRWLLHCLGLQGFPAAPSTLGLGDFLCEHYFWICALWARHSHLWVVLCTSRVFLSIACQADLLSVLSFQPNYCLEGERDDAALFLWFRQWNSYIDNTYCQQYLQC